MGARKQQQLRLAKLSLPRLHNAVARERLFAMLDARKQQPIVWVGGPAGAGKTTLVASYLEARKARALWYQVDEGDKDPATFFYYLSELAQDGGRKRALPQLSTPDLSAFARHYFREFFRQVGVNVLLVLDNCQDAAGEAFHLILRIACEELPQQVNLICLSRGVLPSELARLAAHGSVQHIEWRDLRLTVEEAQALADARGKTDRTSFESAYRLSDGWATGLILSLAHARAVNEATAKLRTREALFTYLLNEMLARASADARKVLTHAALFPQVTAPLAQAISGIANAGEVLEELYRNQYLVDRKVEAELSYQFHDLFRDFLLDALARDLPAPELAILRQRAAIMLESGGHINDAVQLFRQASDHESVVRAIKTYAPSLYYQGRWQTLLDWFVELPKATAGGDPWLAYWQGRALIVPDMARARLLLEQAHAQFLAKQDDSGLSNASRALIDTVVLLGEPYTPFQRWLIPLEESLARSRNAHGLFGNVEGCSAYLEMIVFGGGKGQLIEEVRQSFEQMLLAPHLSTVRQLTVALTLISMAWFIADVGLLERSANVLRLCVEKEDLNPIERYWGCIWIAMQDWFSGRTSAATRWFERAVELAAKFKFSAVDNFASCSLSMLRREAGLSEAAERTLLEVSALCDPQQRTNWAVYNHALAFQNYCRNDLIHAVQHEHVCNTVLRASDSLGGLAWHWPLEAAYCAQGGLLNEAVSLVETARSATSETVYRVGDAVYCFVLAEVATRRGIRAEAIEHLREGLQHSRNPIKAGMLFSMTRALPRLLTLAIEESIEPDTVRYLIQRWNLVPEVATQDHWPWPVKIYALGEFRVLVNDAPLPSKGKTHFKVLALLKAIIAAGARQVSTQTLAEWLWPDADGDAATINMRTSLHRLRKLLGRDEALLYHDGKVSLNEKICWLDVLGFETGNAVDVLDLYRGSLLPQDDFSWLLAQRERLRAKFQRTVLGAGKRHENAKEYETAAALYERCLEVDPSAEVLYRQLMLCLKSAGRHIEALEAFARCRRMAQVSKETQQAYESLLRG